MKQMEQDLISKYMLSDKKHKEIFEVIKNMLFSNFEPVEKPTAIIVGAQPGSGKGSLIGYSKNVFFNDNIVIITTDDYKPFHPKASEIAIKHPTSYCSIVEKDSAKWTNEILNYAIENKYNFIFEVTLRNERILERIKELKEKNYNVIVRGLAVSYIESLLSAYERYEKQVETRSWGRFFNPLSYNETYKNIPNVIEKIELDHNYDVLEIYKRGTDIKSPILIYGNYSKQYKKEYSQYSELPQFEYRTAKEAIMKCRNDDLNNIKNVLERYQIIKDSFERRVTTREEKLGLQQLEEIVNNY